MTYFISIKISFPKSKFHQTREKTFKTGRSLLNAQPLTKHRRVDILNSASRAESVLTHTPYSHKGPCSGEDLRLFAEPTKQSARDVLTVIAQGTVRLHTICPS